jgi:hypothetical protein
MPYARPRRTPSDPKAKDAVRRYRTLKLQSKDLFAQMDALVEELIPRLRLGEVIDLGEGQGLKLVDNYAGKNVAFKPHGIRRFELVEARVAEVG